MQKCTNCGADLPENSRFCGKCGTVQDATATEAATTRSNTPPYWTEGGTLPASQPPYPYSTPEDGTLPASQPPYPYAAQETFAAPGSQPSWSPTTGGPATPPPPPLPTEKDDERRGIPPWVPQYGAALGAEAMMGGGQPYGYGAPVVQGTPQIGGVPNVAGTPMPYANAPAGNPVQGPGYAGGVAHYPPGGQPATYYPPQQGTPAQPREAEQHGGQHAQHAQHAQHLHHAAAGATKVAGAGGLKTIVIVIATVVVVAAGGIGAAAFFLNRPQPVISATSKFKVGNTLAAADGTVLRISGQKFSGNSTITFLLDGNPAPGNPRAQSDANGSFSADVPVTAAWSIGTHTLTAKDAGNNATKNSISVMIVQPGTANTPGPNGAPPDDATFNLNLSVKGTYSLGNQPFTNSGTLHITGHPDPNGGTVCGDDDTGKPITTSNATLNNQTPFTETYSLSCQGSYKGGKVTYTEMILSAVITYTTSGVVCTMNGTHVFQQITGSYTAQNTFSGTLTYPGIPQSDFHCTNSSWYFYYVAGQGTWSGGVSGLQS